MIVKKFSLKLFSLIVGLCIFSNVFSQNQEKTLEELFKSGSVTIGHDSIDSSIIVYQGNYLPFIKVEIDGKKYLFLFDTGSSGCFISEEIAGLAKVERTVPIDNGNGNDI